MRILLIVLITCHLSFIGCKTDAKPEFRDKKVQSAKKARSTTLLTFKGFPGIDWYGLNYYDQFDRQMKMISKDSLRLDSSVEELYYSKLFYAAYYPIKTGDEIKIWNIKDDGYPFLEPVESEFSSFELNFPAYLGKRDIIIFDYSARKRIPNKLPKLSRSLQENFSLAMTLLDSCLNVRLVGEKYYKWIKNTILFSKEAETLIMNLTNPRQIQLNLADTIHFRSIAYRSFLRQFLRCNVLNDRKNPEQQFELINDKYEGKIKDYFLLKIYEEIYRTKPNERLVYSQKFDSYCKDAGYRKYVQQTVYDLKYLTKNATDFLIDHGGRQISLDSLIASFKGSLIYIDFWASWCLPCRVEMPTSLNLAAKLRNEKIKFLYISTDDNIGDWRKAAGQEELQVVQSYKFLNFNKSKLRRSYNIEEIPRYLLIDKQGKIIESNAPRPTDKKLLEIISKYLPKININ